jgi:hypothetical protein
MPAALTVGPGARLQSALRMPNNPGMVPNFHLVPKRAPPPRVALNPHVAD